MKYFLILGLCLLTIVPSCKKSTGSTTYMTTATITGGYDYDSVQWWLFYYNRWSFCSKQILCIACRK